MSIDGFDHVALPTERPEEMIAFYRGLGFTVIGEEEWRQGRSAAIAFALGDAKINMHPPALWTDPRFTLRGPTAVPGCGDFCFAWNGSIGEAIALLERADAEIIEGPVPRRGGRALGTATGTSVYTRDPDGNLLEFISYA